MLCSSHLDEDATARLWISVQQDSNSIPCSTECKVVGKILLDHPLSYDLTANADVPAVYLQQFWQIVHKVPNTKDTIRFKMDTQEITYIVDMFRATLKLPVETPDKPFVAPVTIKIIESFMYKVGYQGVVDKVSAFYMNNLAQPWETMFKVFNRCLTTRTSRDDQTKINILQLFHADDIPLVSVYTTENVLVRGMLIPDEFLTEEICATDDFKEYETVFMNVVVPMNQSQPGKKRKQIDRESSSLRKSQKITIKKKKQSTTLIPPPSDDQERDEVAEATILSLTLHKTALAAEAQENIAKVQKKLDEEEIENMVEGNKDEESYASKFADSMINDDVADSGTRLEPVSHKEHPGIINDDDDQIEKEKNDEEIEKEKKYEAIKKEKKHDDDEKIDEVVMEKDYDDDVEKVDEGVKEKSNVDVATGSMEFKKEKMQTPIPSPTKSLRKVSSSDKIVSEKLTAIIREVLDHCNKVVLEQTFAKTKEMINKEMPHLVNFVVNKNREVDLINAQEMIFKEFSTHAPKMIEELFQKYMQHTTLNLYPTTSSSTAGKSMADLQQQLYLNMKSKPQDQAADPDLWEILKAKFEKQ
ncbi:hypothetical protein Tco_0674264 [Tanacetum coccineum]